MLVITAWSTCATFAMRVISPGSLMPSSMTPIWASGGISVIVIGTPTWLLLFPGVLYTENPAPRAAAIISLVVVFPTLPVMPTKGSFIRPRYQAPRACSAALVSSTRIHGRSDSIRSCRLVNTAAAPCSKAWPINRWASTFSPIMGTKRSCPFMVLESMLI